MNKLFTKIAGLSLGIALAFGVGFSLANSNKVSEVKAVESVDTTYDLSTSLPSTLTSSAKLNNDSTRGMGVSGKSYTLTTTKTFSNVTKIVVNAASNYKTYADHTVSATVGESAFGSAVNFSAKASTDYTITGTKASGVVVVSLNNCAEGTTKTNSIWVKTISVYTDSGASYTVSFNSNGGTGTMDSVQAGATYTAPECTFTAPTQKTFDGWKVNNEGDTYKVGDSITLTGGVTLYAQWAQLYTVSFDSNTGTGTMESVSTVASYEIPACEFTAPEGKKFDSWNDSASGTGVTYSVGEEVTLEDDLTLYAIWVEKGLSDTYDFATNFSTYAAEWSNSYISRSVDPVEDLGAGYAATINMNKVSKQTTTITNKPVFACNNSSGWIDVLEFTTDADNMVITAVTVTFAQWGSKTPTVALFSGIGVEGDPLTSVAIGSESLALSATSMNTTQFTIGFCAGKTSNVQLGLVSIDVTFRASGITTYANTFLSAGLCDGGVTKPSTTYWGNLNTSYSDLSADDQAIFTSVTADEEGNAVQQCVARYEYIVGKYGTTTYTNFMSRSLTKTLSPAIKVVNDNNSVIAIVIASATSLIAISCFIASRRKKETN